MVQNEENRANISLKGLTFSKRYENFVTFQNMDQSYLTLITIDSVKANVREVRALVLYLNFLL